MDEVTAFLESARRRYPFGIPRSLIDSVTVSKTSTKLFIVGDTLTAQGRELLISAIEKGLKWKEFEVFLINKSSDAEIKTAIMQSNPVALIVFGETSSFVDLAPGNLGTVHGRAVLKTLHPDAVSKDPSLKREYWSQLQKIIPELI